MADEDFQTSSLGDIVSGALNNTGADADLGDETGASEVEGEVQDTGAEKVAGTDATTKTGEAADKAGQGAPPAQKAKPTTAESPTVAQARDERRKRQAAEQRLETLERELAQLKQGQTQKPKTPERPDAYVDPDGALKWDQDRAAEQRAETANNAFAERCVLTESFMIEIKGEEDYREKETAFDEAVKANPALAAQLRRHPNPAKFAYDEGKRFLTQQEFGNDPAAYRTKLETELREKIEAEVREKIAAENAGGGEQQQEQKPELKSAAKAAIPTTLAKVAAAAAAPRDAGKGGTWGGPTPLSDIIKN